MAAKAKWTILTYIAAHNNLQYFGKQSFDQIIGVGSTPEIVLGILFDWPDGAARYIAGSPGHVVKQEQLNDYDSADPQTIIETAKWVYSQYPAEKYGLILWSHGNGWRPEELKDLARVDDREIQERAASPGRLAFFRSTLQTILRKEKEAERAICFDDGTGHSLDTLELNRVTSELKIALGQPLELLGMDACLMANIEVAYQLKDSVKFLVASEELVPGHSWPYNMIFGSLQRHSNWSGADLAISIVDKYVDFYAKNPPLAGDVTKIALDLQKIDLLAGAINTLAGDLLTDLNRNADTFWNVQQKSMEKESFNNKRRPNKFDFHLWDIGSLASGLAENPSVSGGVAEKATSIAELLRSGGPVVLAEGHLGQWFKGIGGLSIYLVPPLKQRISPSYGDLSFSKDIKWIELLHAYHSYYS